MLKYESIISGLSDEIKIKLLSDITAAENGDYAYLGIPQVKIGYTKNYTSDLFPQDTSLIHAWDPELWSSVAEAVGKRMKKDGSDLAICPGPKTKFSPYRKEISEDPYLCEAYSRAYTDAIDNAGQSTALSSFYLTRSDTKYLDTDINEPVIYEYFTALYENVLKGTNAIALVSDARILGEKYENVNKRLQNGEFSESGLKDSKFMICPKAPSDSFIRMLTEGIICLSADPSVLASAYARHKKLEDDIKRAQATGADLEAEVNASQAISSDMLNSALDRYLDFLFEVKKRSKPYIQKGYDDTLLAKRATLASVVLLKNESHILPIKSQTTIRIIGDLAFDESEDHNSLAYKCIPLLEEEECLCKVFSRGYDSELERNDALTNSYRDADDDSVYLLFLGFTKSYEKRITPLEKLTLPANQIALIEKIKANGKQIIAVIPSGYAPDCEFAKYFAGMIMVPMGLKYTAEALIEVITGKYNPDARLGYSLYSRIDTDNEKLTVYKEKFGQKIGRFIGYRYYDTANLRPAFEFGHGLSYTTFEYSGITVVGNTVSFNLRNTGYVEGTETVQLYIGEEAPVRARPKKELIGFEKVTLAKGETRRISMTIELPKIFSDGKFRVPHAKYTVYVGASVTDIRLTDSYIGGADTLKPDNENLSDYLQSITNITKEKYTLEAEHSSMKFKSKNIVSAICAMIMAIGLGIYNSNVAGGAIFLTLLTAILAIGSIVFFVVDYNDRSRHYKEEREKINAENKKHFETAENLAEFNAATMFKDEFDTEEATFTPAAEIIPENFDAEYLAHINKSVTFASAVTEFVRFAKDRGIEIKRPDAENIFASIATSRLLVFYDVAPADFSKTVSILTEYFSTSFYLDKVDSSYVSEASALYTYDDGARIKKNLLLAMESAANNKERIHIAALDGVIPGSLSSYFAPFGKYVRNPSSNASVKIGEYSDNLTYYIPKNLWFFLNIKSGEHISRLPGYATELSSVHTLTVSSVAPSGDYTSILGFSYYQLDYLANKLTSKFTVPEEKWKKVDKIENFVKEHSDYTIGNKSWRAFEKHISTLGTAGRNIDDAIDSSISIKLLPSMMKALLNSDSEMDISLSELFDITFGDENTAACQSFIKRFNANAQKDESAASAPGAASAPEIVYKRADNVGAEERFVSRPIEQAFGGSGAADNFKIVNKPTGEAVTTPDAQGASYSEG